MPCIRPLSKVASRDLLLLLVLLLFVLLLSFVFTALVLVLDQTSVVSVVIFS